MKTHLSPSAVIDFLGCTARGHYRRANTPQETGMSAIAEISKVIHARVALAAEKNDPAILTERQAMYDSIACLFNSIPPTNKSVTLDDFLAAANAMLDYARDNNIWQGSSEVKLALTVDGQEWLGYVDCIMPRIPGLPISEPLKHKAIDWKLKLSVPYGIEYTHWLQGGMYCMLTGIRQFQVCYFSINYKRKNDRIVAQQFYAEFNDRSLAVIKKIVGQVRKLIDGNICLPNRGYWLCTEQYCPYFKRCHSDWS